MSIATVNHQLIHYEVLGRGQPLLFVHGWLGSWRYWWPSMQALSAGQRSYAFDLWGFGDSSKSPSLYNLSMYVDMIDQFIQKMGFIEPVILVGHSLGAGIALRYTNQHPNKVKKLVAVSLPVEGGLIHSRLSNNSPDAVVAKVLGKSNSFSEVDSEMRKSDQRAVNQLATELRELNLRDELVECTRPLLLISGKNDQVVQLPPNSYTHLHDVDKNRFFVALDKCNHFPMLEQKVKFNRLLLDFIHADDSVTELMPKEHWQRRVR